MRAALPLTPGLFRLSNNNKLLFHFGLVRRHAQPVPPASLLAFLI